MHDLDERELDALLERLEDDERHLSITRRRLHDRIATFPAGASAANLERRERELSKERQELHRRIDELRARRIERRSPRSAD